LNRHNSDCAAAFVGRFDLVERSWSRVFFLPAKLRSDFELMEAQTKDFCFVCGIPREKFERDWQAGQVPKGGGAAPAAEAFNGPDGPGGGHGGGQTTSGNYAWSRHYHLDHNLWNYAFFMVALRRQGKDDDDGLEQFVRRSMERGDVDWFPKGLASVLKVVRPQGSEAIDQRR
jgi:hypothetical protein